MSRIVLVLPLLLALAGCDSSDAEPVMLRVENASAVDFASVSVSLPGATASYGAVAAGRSSDYREFETAYRYAGVSAQAGAETFSLVPIDYVGETPLAAGRYTYVLTVEGSTLRLDLRRD